MLPLVNVGHKSLGDYATLVSRGLMNEIQRLAEPLQGKRVAHVSATAFGGGVAEINYTLVPLMADAGLDVEWRIIHGEDEFFEVTKAIHNGLQGAERSLSEDDKAIFARFNTENAREFPEADYDYVIIHDPQPVAMIDSFPERQARWIWRGHIDFSTPNEQVFGVLLPSIQRYDASIFHMREYVPHVDLQMGVVWPPAIDPLMPKNMALSPEDAAYIVDQFGIDVERPLLTQVSRFDPWKDPLGVIDAYRQVKRRFPDVQLALVGSMAHDDPEGIMEAMALGRPVVSTYVAGIPELVIPGETGWLVDSVDACASACIEILRDPDEARTRALKGKEHVRRNFLTPRLLRDWLVLFNKLAGNDTGGSEITVV